MNKRSFSIGDFPEKILVDLLQQLNREMEPDAILTKALQSLDRLGRWYSISLSLPSSDGQAWQVRVGNRLLPREIDVLFPIARGVIGRAYRSAAVQIVTNVQSDPDFFNGAGSEGVQSELAAPLVFEGNVLGVLDLQSTKIDDFSAVDVALVKSITEIIAIALKNAQRFAAIQREIVERLLAESELRETLINLEAAEEQAGVGSWYYDVATGDGWWSKQMHQLFWHDPDLGVPSDEEYTRMVHPEDRLKISMTRVLMRKEILPEALEYRTNPELGEVRILRPRYRVKQSSSGVVEGFFGTVLDVTDLLHAEEALRHSEQRFYTAFHASPTPQVITLVDSGKILSANEGFCLLMEYEQKELIGWNTVDLDMWANPVDRDLMLQRLQRDGQVREMELLVRTRSGRLRTVLASFVPFELMGLKCVVSTAVDMTDRLLMQRETEEARAFAQSTIDALSAHICVLDESGVILSVNQAWRNFAEAAPPVPPEHWIGSNYLTVCDRARGANSMEAAPVARGIRAVMSGDLEQYLLEYPCHAPLEQRWFVVRVTRFIMNGILRIVVAHENITERIIAEEALKKRLAVEKMVAEISARFVGVDEGQIDAEILAALAQIAQEAGVDRSYIYGYDPTEESFLLRHEWAAPEIKPTPEAIKRLQVGDERFIPNGILRGEIIEIARVNDLPDSQTRQDLLHQGVQSLLCIPLVNKSGVSGIVCFDSVRAERNWLEQDVTLLQLVGRIIASANERVAHEQEFRLLNLSLERRVEERTAEVQDLYDNAPCGYHSLDADGRIVRINQTELDWLGYTRQDMVGHLFIEFITPESQNLFTSAFPEFMVRGQVRDVNYELIRKDGGVLPILISATAIYDQRGKFLRSRSVVLDNSERLMAEMALRSSEMQNRLLFEEAPDAYTMLDAEGRILRANNAYSLLTGVEVEKMLGKTAVELGFVSAETFEYLSATMAEAIGRGDNVASAGYSLTSAGGSLREVESSIYWMVLGGEERILVTSRDVSSRKQTEEALRLASVEMERTLRLKDEFLANMSHELRTPLNAILGISESLGEQLVGVLNEKQALYVNVINESGKHLLGMINDILDLAKVDAGKIKLELNEISLDAVCQSSLRMVKELAQKKRLEISYANQMDNDLILADERRLKEMIVNLLSNAVKFTPQGGKVGLSINGDSAEGQVQITVWDTGIGMPESDLPRLFQPFVQLDGSLTREHSGTGLGLALVAQLARLHGGSVGVESALGQGSRFTILLPWTGGKPFAKPISETIEPSRDFTPLTFEPDQASKTILLVEDTEAVSMLIQDYLQLYGYRVELAKDGLEGVDQARRLMPDLILMDVQMPLMNGLEATRLIRMASGLETTPIIALTALAMPGDRERCLAAGMSEYLSKPVNLHDLLTLVRSSMQTTDGEAK